jgi:D-alanine-D-alanine ligase
VLQGLREAGHEVLPTGITRDGRWLRHERALEVLVGAAGERALPSTRPLAAAPEEVEEGLRAAQPLPDPAWFREVDVVFPVLHGPFGEDGTVQGLLELLGVPYVGCGVTASAVGMDKALMKRLFQAAGLPVVEHLVVPRSAWRTSPGPIVDAVESHLGYPVFVKPTNLGSSVGVSKVHERSELAPALEEAARHDRKILIERGLDAREIECSVLGNDRVQVSLPGEIIPSREFYDYEAKYLDDASELLIPAPLEAEQVELVRQLALRAYRALDCAGMARVDFLLERRSETFYVSEVNTIPGFTPISMYPKLWEATGLSYPHLLSRLVELALERHRERAPDVA